MSRVFEALQRANPELSDLGLDDSHSAGGHSQLVTALTHESAELDDVRHFEIPTVPQARLVAWTHPNSLAAEKLRTLAARLRHAQQRRQLKRLLVTSAIRGDGKSTVSANLAITLASQGAKTLLIDGDLHQPSLARTLGVDGAKGFASWHRHPDAIGSLLYRGERVPLWFLPAGVCLQQPLTLIQSAKTVEFFQRVVNHFDWIVIDSPPLMPLADAGIWATVSDAVLLLVREGVTPKKGLDKCLASIDRSKLFGVIMNDATTSEQRYYQTYYSGKTHAVPSPDR
jgi:capsular exopolysaccharide synthesis family protein